MGHPVRGDCVGVKASCISHVTAPIDCGIAVEEFTIVTFVWHANSIVLVRNRGEVTHAYNLIILVLGFSKKGDHGVGCIGKVDPLETVPVVIEFVQRRLLAVEMVEVAYQALESPVPLEIAEVPFQAGIVVPLTPLSEFSPHE